VGWTVRATDRDGLRAERLPAALIQGLRDNFGAHTYQRTDRPGAFHINWAGRPQAAHRLTIPHDPQAR